VTIPWVIPRSVDAGSRARPSLRPHSACLSEKMISDDFGLSESKQERRTRALRGLHTDKGWRDVEKPGCGQRKASQAIDMEEEHHCKGCSKGHRDHERWLLVKEAHTHKR
jgi:hypothetical protein